MISQLLTIAAGVVLGGVVLFVLYIVVRLAMDSRELL